MSTQVTMSLKRRCLGEVSLLVLRLGKAELYDQPTRSKFLALRPGKIILGISSLLAAKLLVLSLNKALLCSGSYFALNQFA